MEKLKVYFNPKCSKCIIAKDFLDDNKKEYDLYEYLDNGVTLENLKEILRKGNLNPLDIIRKNEEEYKKYISKKNLSDEEILKIIVKHPKLLQRPIILNNKSAVVARDEESLERVKKLK